MKDTQRRDSLLTVMGLAVLVAAFVFLLYLPGRRRADSLRQEMQQADQVIRDVPLRLAELESLNGEIARRTAYLAETQPLFLSDAGQQTIVGQVAELARQAGLTIARQEPLPLVEHKSFRAMPFRVTIHGSFQGICQFLYGLERQEHLITVDELTFHAQSRQTAQAVLAEVSFSVYVMNGNRADSRDNDDSSTPRTADI